MGHDSQIPKDHRQRQKKKIDPGCSVREKLRRGGAKWTASIGGVDQNVRIDRKAHRSLRTMSAFRILLTASLSSRSTRGLRLRLIHLNFFGFCGFACLDMAFASSSDANWPRDFFSFAPSFFSSCKIGSSISKVVRVI